MKQIWKDKEIKKLKETIGKKKIVLVGGCFDVIHLGHITFLKKAKSNGEVLVVFLESDKNIEKNKGKDRPINNQKNRAKLLVNLKMVDYVVKLSEIAESDGYLDLIKKINPQVIAVTENDVNLENKTAQAKEVGAKIVQVTKPIPHQSTSRIIEIITRDH